MKKHKWAGRVCAAALAGTAACVWLFPQTIFRDCLHAVFPQEQENREVSALSEEEYRDLFRFSKSNYKVTWKFFQKD